MKTYKLNNIEISKEEIQKVIRENPELLKEDVKGRYFFPKEGERFFSVDSQGFIFHETYANYCFTDISLGGFKTESEAKLASEKQKAIVRCWKWAQENAPFEPDWEDDTQIKFRVAYIRGTKFIDGAL